MLLRRQKNSMEDTRLQTVKIKSNRYGINLVLDEHVAFEELLKDVQVKFEEAAKFFQNASMALEFEGRKLTQKEENQILEVIKKTSAINVVCVVDRDESKEALYRQHVEEAIGQAKTQLNGKRSKRLATRLQADKGVISKVSQSESEGELNQIERAEGFYRGTLRSGQVLESQSGVVIIGDVNPGAKVISYGNIVILGALKGVAFAGAGGDDECVIVALNMQPLQVQISNILAKSPDEQKPRRRGRPRKKQKEIPYDPQIAFAKNGNIYIESISRDVIKSLLSD